MQWIYKIIDGSIDLEKILQDEKVFFPNNYGFKEGDTIYFLHIDGIKNRIRWQANVETTDEDVTFIQNNYLRLVKNQQGPIALSDEYIVLNNIEPEFNTDLNLAKFQELGLVFAYGSVAKNIGIHSDVFNLIISSHTPQESMEFIEKSYLDKLFFDLKEVKEFKDEIADHMKLFFANPNLDLCHELINRVENFDSAIGIFYDENLDIWYNRDGVIHHPELFFDVYKEALEIFENEKILHPLFDHGWATLPALEKMNNINAVFSTNIPLLLKLIHFFSFQMDIILDEIDFDLSHLLETVLEKILNGANLYFKSNSSVDYVSAMLTLAHQIQLSNSQLIDYNLALEKIHQHTKRLECPKKYTTKSIYPKEEFNIIHNLLELHKHVLVHVGNLIHREWFIEAFFSYKEVFKGPNIVESKYSQFLEKALIEPYREYIFIASSEDRINELSEVFKSLSLKKARNSNVNINNVQSLSLSLYPEDASEKISTTPYVLVFNQFPVFNQESVKNYFFENFSYNPDLKWLNTLDDINSIIKERLTEEHCISYEMFFQFDWKSKMSQEELWKYFLDYRIKPYVIMLNFKEEDLNQLLNKK